MQEKISKFILIVIGIVLAVVLAGAIVFVVHYTNNFTTDITTFYVQYDKQEIRQDIHNEMQFEKGTAYTFRCRYPLGFPANEKGERYKVSVEASEAGKLIEYRVDGTVTKLSKAPELTNSFEIEKDTDSFTFCIPTGTTLTSILRTAYSGKEITDVPAVDLTTFDFFELVVKSYNEGTTIRIGFRFDGKYWSGGGAASDDGEDPDIPIGNYSISHKIISGAEGRVPSDRILFQSEKYALPDSEQAVAIGIVENELENLAILAVYVQGEDGTHFQIFDLDSDGVYYFIMPECNVTILISTYSKNGAMYL